MRTLICLMLVLLAVNGGFAQTNAEMHNWRVTMKIVDENGKPVTGADATVLYFANNSRPTAISGTTGTNGQFTAGHSTGMSLRERTLLLRAKKDGSYQISTACRLSQDYSEQAWNPTVEVTMKQIKHPTAMYVKLMDKGLPVADKLVGQSLETGEWASPYGPATNTDLLYFAHLVDPAKGFYRLTLSFPNPGDGIQAVEVPQDELGGALMSPHEAPTNGYKPEWVHVGDFEQNLMLFFRVRTILDDKGNVKSARYGKIYAGGMEFIYYLNPTPNDRNMEFDPKQNLIKSSDTNNVREFYP